MVLILSTIHNLCHHFNMNLLQLGSHSLLRWGNFRHRIKSKISSIKFLACLDNFHIFNWLSPDLKYLPSQ